MNAPKTCISRPLISRRAVVVGSARLAYAAPLISASYGLSSMRTSADEEVSTDSAAELIEEQNALPLAIPGDGFEVVDEDGDGLETVTVDGSSSADPDGKIVSYRWTRGNRWLSNEAVALIELPIGTHRLTLTVTDDQGATASAKIRIRVRRGEPRSETPTETERDAVTDEIPVEEPALPAAPYGVKTQQKFAEVAITWQVDPGTPVPYRVYRCNDDGTLDDQFPDTPEDIDRFGWVLIKEEWAQLSYRDLAVQVGVPYLYSVKSFDGVNESERSNIARITLQPVEEEAPTEVPVVEPTTPPVVEEPTSPPPADTPTPEPVIEDTVTPEAAPEETVLA